MCLGARSLKGGVAMLDPFGLVMDILNAVLEGFISIFELAGQEAFRRSVDTVLTAASPNLSSDWFLATYFVMFGLGCVLAVTVSMLRALKATFANDAYRFFTVWKHNVLHYLLGYWLPAGYLFLHLIFVKAGQAMASAFGLTQETADNVNLTTGSIANRFLAGVMNWGLGGLLELQSWFIITFLPTVVLLLGVFLLGAADIGGEKGEKVWSGFLALISTSLLSILLYVLWFGIASQITRNVPAAGPVDTGVVWGTTLMLFLALFTPIIAWFVAYKRISLAVATGSAVLLGQMRGSQQIRTMGAANGGRTTTPSPAARRNTRRVARAESMSRRASQNISRLDETRKGISRAERVAIVTSQRSAQAARGASTKAAAGRTAAAGTASAGTLAVASIVASRLARKKIERERES